MSPLSKEEFDQHIEHAKSRRWNPNNDEATNYSRPEQVYAYCAEILNQKASLLYSIFTSKDDKLKKKEIHEKILENIFFFNVVVGRTAELEGGMIPSFMDRYDIEEGNQVDIFLKEIGFLK